MLISYLVLFLTTVFASCLAQDRSKWIDPYEMNTDIRSTEKRSVDDKCECPVSKNSNPGQSFSHYKRLISLLLSSVYLDRDGGLTHYIGIMKLNLKVEDYDLLKKMSVSIEEDEEVFRKIDEVLSRVLTKPKHEVLVELFVDWTDRIYFTVFNRTTAMLVVCVSVLYCSYRLLRAELTLWMVVKYLVFLGWVVDFGFTWMHLLQEEEINKVADSFRYKSIPEYCDPSKLHWYQLLWSHIASSSECRDYHQNLLQNVFWKISPFTVFSHQIGTIIVNPAMYIGTAISKLTNALLSDLPFGLNLILLPLLLLFLAIIICLLLSFGTKTGFEINIFHLLTLKFGNQPQNHRLEQLQNLSTLVDAMHRNAVQDVIEEQSPTPLSCSDSVPVSKEKSDDENNYVVKQNGETSIEQDANSMDKHIKEKNVVEVSSDGSGDARL